MSNMGRDLSHEGYTLVWQEDFDGEAINREDWNVEVHEPGWVNEEWQKYVDTAENIFLRNGKLILRPIRRTDADGNFCRHPAQAAPTPSSSQRADL